MKNIYVTLLGILLLSVYSCKQNLDKSDIPFEQIDTTSVGVVTSEMQSKLTPDLVLEDLLKGNERFVSGKMLKRNFQDQVAKTESGQYPKAVVLGCIDSRVPIEYIFDQGIGDVFTVRVAGNIEDKALLGSIEYGLGVAGSKLLIVLGHENCGAVKSAIDNVDVGSENVTFLLNEIEPSIIGTEGERNANNKSFFDSVVQTNVIQTIEDIRKRSSIINNLEAEGKIKIIGAVYSVSTGKVSVLKN